MSITFGIPKKEVVNKERFPESPVVTVQAWEGKGFNKRFVINQKAVELLNVIPGTSSVMFAFDEEDSYLAKQTGEDSLLVGKNMAFSNKKFYEYLSKKHNLDNTKDTYLELTGGLDLSGTMVYLLKEIVPVEAVVDSGNPIADKEIEHIPESEADSPYESTIGDLEEDIPFEPHGNKW